MIRYLIVKTIIFMTHVAIHCADTSFEDQNIVLASAGFEVIFNPIPTYTETVSNTNQIRTFSQNIYEGTTTSTTVTEKGTVVSTSSLETTSSTSVHESKITVSSSGVETTTLYPNTFGGSTSTNTSELTSIEKEKETVSANISFIQTTAPFEITSADIGVLKSTSPKTEINDMLTNNTFTYMNTSFDTELRLTWTTSKMMNSTTTLLWSPPKTTSRNQALVLTFKLFSSVELAPVTTTTNITETKDMVPVEPLDSCMMISNGSFDMNNTRNIPDRCIELVGDTDTCKMCYIGFWLDTQTNKCLKCPVGKYRDEKTDANICIACEPGKSTYNTSGQSSCTPCHINFSTYGLSGQPICTQCPENSRTPRRGTSACTCIRGTHLDGNGCVSCPIGTHDSGQTISELLDPSVQYLQRNQCSPCNMGLYSNSLGATSCQMCPPGTFSPRQSLGVSACIECLNDTYNPLHGQAACAPCYPHSFMSVKGGTYCHCKQGYYLSKLNASTFQCNACPPGTYGPDASVSELDTQESKCQWCNLGTYSDTGGLSQCKLCPIGKFANTTRNTRCWECEPVLYTTTLQEATTSASQCICLEGSYRQNNECILCSQGHYQPAINATACIACPSGKYSEVTGLKFDCFLCEHGFFNDEMGKSSCKKCSTHASSSTFSRGATSAADCLCYPGFVRSQEPTDCIPCTQGFFQPETFNGTQCRACGPGTFSTEMARTTECSPCPIGSYTNMSAQTACKECTPIFSTTLYNASKTKADCICLEGSKRNTTTLDCDVCLAGTFQNGRNATTCYACNHGTFSSIEGRNITCEKCAYGTYADQTGLSACKQCGSSAYSQTLLEGSVLPSSCICLPGSSRMNNDSGCEPCPTGSFQTTTNMTYCISCSMGKFSDVRGRHMDCDLCGPGLYSDTQGTTACSGCSNYSMTLKNDSQSILDCICIPGSRRHMQTKLCEPCEPGAFQSELNATACSICWQGKYASGVGRTSECDLCPKATFSSSNASTACTLCSNTSRATTKQTGSTQKSQCMCSKGFVYDEIQTECIPCEAGTFQPFDNGTICFLCEGYSYSFSIASYECKDCLAGSVSTPKNGSVFLAGQMHATSVVCALCRPGFYQPLNQSSTCIACPAGYMAPEQGATSCVECDLQTFNPIVGAISCQQCPSGSDTSSTGSNKCTCRQGSYLDTVSQTCIKCSPGSYQRQYGSTYCEYCPIGTYSKAWGQFEFCALCELDTFNPSMGMSACLPCSRNSSTFNRMGQTACSCMEGFFIDTNSSQCKECQAGFYTDNEMCNPCPMGTFSKNAKSTHCSTCDTGSFNTGMGNFKCENCIKGSIVSESKDACTCPTGTYNKTLNSTEWICSPCTISCPQGYFMARECSGNSDIICSSCTNNCSKGLYIHANCSHYHDTICRPCSIRCLSGFYLHKSCTLFNDMECKRCEKTCPMGHYIFSFCSEYQNLQCIKCPQNSFPDPRQPTQCKACLPNQYLDMSIGMFSCKTCDGFITSNKSMCLAQCIPGEYPSIHGLCSQCPPHTYGVDGLTCVACPSFADCDDKTHGKTECQPCNNRTGSMLNSKNASVCII